MMNTLYIRIHHVLVTAIAKNIKFTRSKNLINELLYLVLHINRYSWAVIFAEKKYLKYPLYTVTKVKYILSSYFYFYSISQVKF